MRMLIFTPLLYWTFSPEHLFTFFVFFHQWAPVHSEPALHPSRRWQKPYQVCTQVWWQTFPTLTPLTRAKQIRQTVSVTSQSSTPNNKSSRHLWWQFGRWEPRKSMCKQFKMFFASQQTNMRNCQNISIMRDYFYSDTDTVRINIFFNVLLSFFLFLFSFDDGVTPKDQMLQSEMFLAGPRTFPRVLVDFSGMDHVWSRACFNQRH